jgi:hypothetical protein
MSSVLECELGVVMRPEADEVQVVRPEVKGGRQLHRGPRLEEYVDPRIRRGLLPAQLRTTL